MDIQEIVQLLKKAVEEAKERGASDRAVEQAVLEFTEDIIGRSIPPLESDEDC